MDCHLLRQDVFYSQPLFFGPANTREHGRSEKRPILQREGAQRARMNSRAVGPRGPRSSLGGVEADALRSHTQPPPRGGPGRQTRDTATGISPTQPPASGSVDCTLYTTPPEDFSSGSPNQGDPFE